MAVLNFLAVNTVKSPSGFWPWLLRLFSFIPDYAWRIIVFTILLKLVLSPLDFYQKFIMKKNARINEKIKPEIEKLQKQYGDDKAGFQRAQMSLNKAAGIKTFASCLPMILTMVVFLTFYSGLRKVSAYTEFDQYVHRYEVYSARYFELTGIQFTDGIDPDLELLKDLQTAEGYQTDIDAVIISLLGKGDLTAEQAAAWQEYNNSGKSFRAVYDLHTRLDTETGFFADTRLFELSDSVSYTIAVKDDGLYNLKKIRDLINAGTPGSELETAKSAVVALANAKLGDIRQNSPSVVPDAYKTNAFAEFTDFDDLYTHYSKFTDYDRVSEAFKTLKAIAEDEAAQAVKLDYQNNNSGFLWIKSIWRPDSPVSYKFPVSFSKLEVVSDYKDFATRVNASSTYYMSKNAGGLDPEVYAAIKGEDNYNKIMGAILADQGLSKVNGYFILAILAVALSLLSQLITMRQQKKSGQMAAGGATGPVNMKFMMFLMPIMIGIFALSSTSAFTLYMITNSAMSLLINLLTSTILGFIGKTKQKQEVGQTGVVRYGRRDPNDYIKK